MESATQRYELERLDLQWLVRRWTAQGWYLVPPEAKTADLEEVPLWLCESPGVDEEIMLAIVRDFLEFEPVCAENVTEFFMERFGAGFALARFELGFPVLIEALIDFLGYSARQERISIWQGPEE